MSRIELRSGARHFVRFIVVFGLYFLLSSTLNWAGAEGLVGLVLVVYIYAMFYVLNRAEFPVKFTEFRDRDLKPKDLDEELQELLADNRTE